jgi:hypothetical protein
MRPLISRRTFFISLFVFGICIALFFGGRYVIFHLIQKALYNQIEKLKEEGIHVSFAEIDLDPWNGHISVSDLTVRSEKDSLQNSYNASVATFLIRGVEVIPFILSKTLNIKEIFLDRPSLSFNTNTKARFKKGALQGIQINLLHLKNASVIIKETGSDTIVHFTMNIDAHQLALSKDNDSLAWRKVDLLVSNLMINKPGSFYAYSIVKAQLNLEEQTFILDSLKVIPLYDPIEFAKKANEQVSRIDVIVPKLTIQGLEFQHDKQLLVAMKKGSLNFNIDVYRNKKYPFLKKTHSELPMEFLQKLPFQFKIDTLTINNSFVRYEEFAEKGDSTGYITFENINSTVVRIHNRYSKVKEDEIIMTTRARFMGTGDLHAKFTYPADTTQPYRVSGSLKRFPMQTVNVMLTPATRTRVESGTMTNLHFDFIYNKYRSDGNIKLNYKDLRMVSLHETNDHQSAVSKIKTLLLNLFLTRKDMNEYTSAVDKQGTILFYRDPRRAIFHYWWQSILSGLKSAYKIGQNGKDHQEKKKERKSKGKKKA